MENVGKSINVHAGRLRKTISLGTDKQMKATNNAASTLNRYSQQLDSKCIKLERTGARIAEGLSGWLPWLHKQNNADASAQVAAMLRTLAAKTDVTITHFNEYLVAVESNRGVSQAMNAAVDAHIRSFSRVKVVTENIRKACLDNLEILEH
jgi:hypothetical protein